jgi:uncharacterized protein (TIGR03085 family)
MPAPEPAYTDALVAQHGHSLARLERACLADTLDTVDPSAPTLCGGWDAHHLAAHVVLREGSVGEFVSPIPKLGDRAVDLLASRRAYGDLIASLRQGPPRLSVFSLPRIDKRFNSLEYYVHHEDVRRAAPGWQARSMPDWAEAKLWRGLTSAAKLTMRRSSVGVTLVRSDTDETFTAVDRDPSVRLLGLPSELVLYAFGRDSVAAVEIEGRDDAVRTFTAQSFSI